MIKQDPDATAGEKLLRLYQRLVLDGRKHFQQDLANFLDCSPQTIIRMVQTIEKVVGQALVTGLENRRRWYQIRSISRNRLGLEFEELRYLSICRDLADPYLPQDVKDRVDRSIFSFSMLMADKDYAQRELAQKSQFAYCAKGWIDYSPFLDQLENLLDAKDQNKICIVRYLALDANEPKEHRFALSRFVAMHNALYALEAVVSEDYTTVKHFINFAVHRIQTVTQTNKSVTFSLPEMDSASFGLPWHEPKLFRIHFKTTRSAAYIRERIWSTNQQVFPQSDGSLILELVSASEPEIMAWIRSFGDVAELLDCKEFQS